MMAVSASAVTVMVLMVMVAAAFAVVASAALMAQVVEHILYLLISGQSILQYNTCELQRLSG